MKVGILASPRPPEYYLNSPLSSEIDHMEIDIFSDPWLLEEDMKERARRIAELAGSQGIGLSVHTPYTLNLGERIPVIRRAHVETFKRILKLADLLDAKWITTHIGHHIGYREGKKEAFETALSTFRELLKLSEDMGILIAVENLKPVGPDSELVYLCDSIPELLSFLDKLGSENVGVCLDVGHANLAEGVSAYLDAFEKSIICIHAHDNDGREDLHRPPGSGVINWKLLVRELKGRNINAPMVVEVYDDSLKGPAVRYLRKIFLETHSRPFPHRCDIED